MTATHSIARVKSHALFFVFAYGVGISISLIGDGEFKRVLGVMTGAAIATLISGGWGSR